MKLSIKTHGDVNLSKAVQTVLFANGIKWNGGQDKVMVSDHIYLVIGFYNPNTITRHYNALQDEGYTTLDARTEFGKLIDLISQPQSVTFQDGDKTVEVFKDGSVKYGCTTVSSDTVNKIVEERAKLMEGK